MSKAVTEYNSLVDNLDAVEGVTVGQMFGKACIKINGKAFVSQHNETIVFKLSGEHHQKAIAVKGAVLWDPSGKGRPMKEWVALPATERKHFTTLANAALAYVATTA
jgi:hypothetical protein